VSNDRWGNRQSGVRSDEIISQWSEHVSKAAQAFEARWTMLALMRVDADLATRLHDQRNLFVEMVIKGTARDVAAHGAAMCRGYVVAIAALEAANQPDDAYRIGRDPESGVTVAIGDQKAAVNRVREVYGDDVIFISPDEVATLFANVEAFRSVGIVKRRFPGAEILRAGAAHHEGA
jgi:hypothetical protein